MAAWQLMAELPRHPPTLPSFHFPSRWRLLAHSLPAAKKLQGLALWQCGQCGSVAVIEASKNSVRTVQTALLRHDLICLPCQACYASYPALFTGPGRSVYRPRRFSSPASGSRSGSGSTCGARSGRPGSHPVVAVDCSDGPRFAAGAGWSSAQRPVTEPGPCASPALAPGLSEQSWHTQKPVKTATLCLTVAAAAWSQWQPAFAAQSGWSLSATATVRHPGLPPWTSAVGPLMGVPVAVA